MTEEQHSSRVVYSHRSLFSNISTNRPRYHLYLQAAILNEEKEERRRLFYVGATRAQDALVLVIQPPTTEKGIKANTTIREDMAEMFPGGIFPTEDGLYDLDDGGKLDYRLIRVEDTGHAQDLYSAIYEEHFGEEPEQEHKLAASQLPQGHLNPSVDRALENADYHEFSYSTLPEYSGKDSTRLKNERLYGKKTKRGPKSREERDKIRSTALALGKALHAYMEYQILTGEFLAERDTADDGKIDQIAAQFELASKEQKRLRRAIEAWNSSKLARKTRSFEHVDTEVPFYIRFADEADGAKGHKPVYFTGEIDLLGSVEKVGVRASRSNDADLPGI